MVRFSPALLLCSAIALAGVSAPPKPTPTPAPAPAASAAARPAVPTIVVFPFQTSTDLKADTGQHAADLFVQQMNSAGGIDAILAPGNIPRTQFPAYAAKLQADYYLTGYMTPVGNGVSLIEQVVSTENGTVAYGTTAQIDSFDDAASQAVQIHGAILAMEQSEAARYASAQSSSTSTPAPANQANLSKGFSDLAGLFKRHGSATPKPVVQKPSKGVYVVRASGSVPSSNLTQATAAMVDALNAHFIVHKTAAAPANVASAADSICGSDRDNTVATGSLSATVTRHGLGSRTQWKFVFDVYTCFGAKLAESTGEADSLNAAVASAINAYAADHPLNG